MILPENIQELDVHLSFLESLGVTRVELIFPGSYCKNELNVSQAVLNQYGISDVVIDTAEEEEFKQLSIVSAETVFSVLQHHPGIKITVVPKTFLKSTQLFLDDNPNNFDVSCVKLTRKELRINSAGQIIFCDTLRKPLMICDELEYLEDVNRKPELVSIKKAIKHGLPCCKRCCKSIGLTEKHKKIPCLEEKSV
jgi:hypothetical protein